MKPGQSVLDFAQTGAEVDCWHWLGRLDRYGYGRVCFRGRDEGAHRAVLIERGIDIPKGYEVDHLCRCRDCVNPLHLEVVTKAENTARSMFPSAMNARKTHCKNGHAFDEVNTYSWNGRRCCRTCNRRHAAARLARMEGEDE